MAGFIVFAECQALAKVFAQPAHMGALPTLRAATDPDVRSGDYFGPRGIGEQQGYPKRVDSNGKSRDLGDARKLWEVSQELTGVEWL